jgi:ubiquinone/menaquinone biosynthesis C-methylase UbiE
MRARTLLLRRTWSRRADSWDHSAMPGLEKIAQAVVDEAQPVDGKTVLDLGSGSGQLTFQLADRAREVTAVDFSQPMLDRLAERARAEGIENVDTRQADLQSLELPPNSVDVIVTNYALHHLRHPEKARLLEKAAGWLKPGGRIVIGDMMFGLASDRDGRRIVATKVAAIARKGPAGWWRLAKNAWKVLVARQECPAPVEAWESMADDAGLDVVGSRRVVAEAAVVTARRPPAGP